MKYTQFGHQVNDGKRQKETKFTFGSFMPLTPTRLNKDGTYYFFEGIQEEEK